MFIRQMAATTNKSESKTNATTIIYVYTWLRNVAVGLVPYALATNRFVAVDIASFHFLDQFFAETKPLNFSLSPEFELTGLPWVWGFPWVWVWDGYGDYDESPWVC